MEEMTEVMKIIPQERVQNRTAEQIVDLFLSSCRGNFQLLKQRTKQLRFHRLSSSTAMNIPVETTKADAHGADGREERGDATGAVYGHGC